MKEDTVSIREQSLLSKAQLQLTAQSFRGLSQRKKEHLKMSLATQEDASTKFWRMPELVEKLMEYLDSISILMRFSSLNTRFVFCPHFTPLSRIKIEPQVRIL